MIRLDVSMAVTWTIMAIIHNRWAYVIPAAIWTIAAGWREYITDKGVK